LGHPEHTFHTRQPDCNPKWIPIPLLNEDEAKYEVERDHMSVVTERRKTPNAIVLYSYIKL
jgi:hypothetical protein